MVLDSIFTHVSMVFMNIIARIYMEMSFYMMYRTTHTPPLNIDYHASMAYTSMLSL